MRHAHISAKARWFGVVIVLVIASSVGSLERPAPSAPPLAWNVAKVLPAIFTTSSAQGPQPTQVAGCSAKAVPGFQFSITVLDFTAVTTGGSDVLITDTDASLNFAGNDGATLTDKFFSGLAFTAGNYNKLKATISPTLTIKAYLSCVISGQTRWYYTDGNANPHASPFVLTEAQAAAAMTATEIKFGGGAGANFTAEIPVSFTVTAGQTTNVNMKVKNEGAFVLWNLTAILGSEGYMVFPGQPDASGASVQ